MDILEKTMESLTPEEKQKVIDFAKFLAQKSKRQKVRSLQLNWLGALEDYKEKYSSVELQHKALELWDHSC